MEITVKPEAKRKVIDIPVDVFRCLSIKAAVAGTNLKHYIEELLAKDAQDVLSYMSDDEAYKWLLKNKPEGNEAASKEEQSNFRNWLRE